ncbi:MAG: cyclomaltodextrinase C-terminal domain-containing protein [Candidatus Sericytochromatia bacterium]|nr:cyclomaltodextrinase C-terminal domain-containing protein [Candidatus Sericytochromatia bacterium]
MRHKWVAMLVTLGVTAACAAPLPQLASNAQSVQVASSRVKANTWTDEVMYFIVTDRFNNGDRSNDKDVEPNNEWGYHGGDIAGVIAKLDYLKAMGVTTVWLTPWIDNDDIPLNLSGGRKLWGFHGYWPKDNQAVDEHLGTMATARSFVQEAHKRGMKVMQDVVLNHTGYQHPWGKGHKDPQDPHYNWFNHMGDIKNWDDPFQSVHGDLAGLPDWNQDIPEVSNYLIDNANWWVKQTGVDGLRVDAIKHVDHAFWRKFTSGVKSQNPNLMLLGEVLHGDPNVVAGYMRDGFDSMFDFPLYYGITDVFARGQSARKLGSLLGQDGAYPDGSFLTPFIDNHDVPRFMSVAGNNGKERLKGALTLTLTVRGMPCIYYGTEAGLKGGGDPENRADMPWNNLDADLTAHIKRLTSLRKQFPALGNGKQLEMWQDDQVYAYSRQAASEEVFVVINTGDRPVTRKIQLRAESKLADGTRMTDQLGGQSIAVDGHSISVTLPARQQAILTVGTAARKR